MTPTLTAILEMAQADPLPPAYTSSYWQRFGRELVIERAGNGLVLRGIQLGTVHERHPLRQILRSLERISYRHVTAPLTHYPSIWRMAKRLAREVFFGLTFDVWKSAVALATLRQHWDADRLSPRTFAVIRDGYGFLGALIRRVIPSSALYCVDLPVTLVFQARTHELADPHAATALLSAGRGSRPACLPDAGAGREAAVTFVRPQDIEALPEIIDCAINIASMQEMTPGMIRTYFTCLRRRSGPQSRFYCVNRLEKVLPGGEVIRFNEYPWQEDDMIFLDGPCPYYTHRPI